MKRHKNLRSMSSMSFLIRLSSMYVGKEDPNTFRRLKDFWPYRIQKAIEQGPYHIDVLHGQLFNYRTMDYEET